MEDTVLQIGISVTRDMERLGRLSQTVRPFWFWIQIWYGCTTGTPRTRPMARHFIWSNSPIKATFLNRLDRLASSDCKFTCQIDILQVGATLETTMALTSIVGSIDAVDTDIIDSNRKLIHHVVPWGTTTSWYSTAVLFMWSSGLTWCHLLGEYLMLVQTLVAGDATDPTHSKSFAPTTIVGLNALSAVCYAMECMTSNALQRMQQCVLEPSEDLVHIVEKTQREDQAATLKSCGHCCQSWIDLQILHWKNVFGNHPLPLFVIPMHSSCFKLDCFESWFSCIWIATTAMTHHLQQLMYNCYDPFKSCACNWPPCLASMLGGCQIWHWWFKHLNLQLSKLWMEPFGIFWGQYWQVVQFRWRKREYQSSLLMSVKYVSWLVLNKCVMEQRMSWVRLKNCEQQRVQMVWRTVHGGNLSESYLDSATTSCLVLPLLHFGKIQSLPMMRQCSK